MERKYVFLLSCARECSDIQCSLVYKQITLLSWFFSENQKIEHNHCSPNHKQMTVNFFKSKFQTYSAISVARITNKWLFWAGSFLLNHNHTVQHNQCSENQEEMTPLSWFFLVIHYHIIFFFVCMTFWCRIIQKSNQIIKNLWMGMRIRKFVLILGPI